MIMVLPRVIKIQLNNALQRLSHVLSDHFNVHIYVPKIAELFR